MEAQVPFHRWEGLPPVVRLQLFRIGSCKENCVICGQNGHGIHSCPKNGTADADALTEAWDKKWLLLMGQELVRYAMCANDDDYRRLTAATFVKSPVDRNSVHQFRIRIGVRSPTTGKDSKAARNFTAQPNVKTTSSTGVNTAHKLSNNGNQSKEQASSKRRKTRKNRQKGAKASLSGICEASNMVIDDDDSINVASAAVVVRAKKPVVSATTNVREVRSSRGTAMTPPPPLPQLPLVQIESPPLLGFRPISSAIVHTDRQARTTFRSLEDKNVRSISASALIPTGKSIRNSADVCIPSSSQRGVELIGGSNALVVVSQSSCKRPYEAWNLEKYVAATSDSRKLFWERASGQKKLDIARALSSLKERDDVVQEARLDFAAEEWGLKIGRAPPVVIDEEDVY